MGKKYFHISPTSTDDVKIQTANGFSGSTSYNSHETNLSIGTTVNGIMKGNGSGASSATPGVDYVTPSQLPQRFVGTVSGGSGVVIFSLVDGGGNAKFTDLKREGCSFWINEQKTYSFDQWTLSTDKKTLTVRCSYPLISALLIAYGAASNGTIVYLLAQGE